MLSTRELRRSARKKPKIIGIWRWLKFVLLAVFAGALIFSGIQIGSYIAENDADMRSLNNTRQVYAQALQGLPEKPDDTSEGAAAPQDGAGADAFAALTRLNADAAGWLTIPGTGIDHPVVQCEDNDYYLNHSFEGKRSAHGCVFMDYRSTADSRHIVIYGHHMKDGSMFGGLPQYELESYCAAHPTVTLNLWGSLSQWQVFSVHTTDDSLLPVAFADDSVFGEFAEGLKGLSLYDTGVDVTPKDTVLTLSTCDGSSRERFVVHAKKIE